MAISDHYAYSTSAGRMLYSLICECDGLPCKITVGSNHRLIFKVITAWPYVFPRR